MFHYEVYALLYFLVLYAVPRTGVEMRNICHGIILS